MHEVVWITILFAIEAIGFGTGKGNSLVETQALSYNKSTGNMTNIEDDIHSVTEKQNVGIHKENGKVDIPKKNISDEIIIDSFHPHSRMGPSERSSTWGKPSRTPKSAPNRNFMKRFLARTSKGRNPLNSQRNSELVSSYSESVNDPYTTRTSSGSDDKDRNLLVLGDRAYLSVCKQQGNAYKNQCLDSCNNVAGSIEPRFWQFEKMCSETAADPVKPWSRHCMAFYSCVYGCSIFGSDREKILFAKRGNALKKLVEETRVANADPEAKCEIGQCHSYCSREAFSTCREMMFRQGCQEEKRKAGGYGTKCPVDCNGAERLSLWISIVITLLIATL